MQSGFGGLRGWSALLGGVLAVAVFLGNALEVSAEEVSEAVAEESQTEGPGLRWWRGSAITYRNEVSALTLDKGAEPNYNPHYNMVWSFGPRFHVHEKLWFSSNVSVSREITEADSTTFANEAILSDLQFAMGSSYRVPVAKIGISGSLGASVPTSKVSQARTLYTSLSGSLGLSRTFPVLSGLSLSYSLRGARNLHEFTTSETETPRIGACDVASGECDPFLNTGVRNAQWRMSNSGTIGIEFVEWLGLSVTAGIAHSWLYPSDIDQTQISLEVEDPRELRYGMFQVVEIHSSPMPSMGIALGMSTASAHRGPDQKPRTPFFNRDTTFYLSLTLDIDGLVVQLTPSSEEASP